MALIIRLGAIVVATVLLTLALGLWIDSRFGTSPCALLIFTFIGVVTSTTAVYRAVQQEYDRYG